MQPPLYIDPRIAPLGRIGRDLHRPECVLASADGRMAVADSRGGVTIIAPDGRQRLIQGPDWLHPNGIALRRDGAFILAHLTDTKGGVFALHPDGRCEPVLTEIDGAPLPPTNFVMIDAQERLWVTVSTRLVPRTKSRGPGIADGFVVLMDKRGARIVADKIAFTNEVRIGPSGEHLYVVETWGQKITRFALKADGSLGARETYVDLPEDVFPDGADFDSAGHLWVTGVYTEQLVRVTADRKTEVMINAGDRELSARLVRDFRAGALIGNAPMRPPNSVRGTVTSICFAGPDRRTAVLGCLNGTSLATFKAPAAGIEPAHWRWPMPDVA